MNKLYFVLALSFVLGCTTKASSDSPKPADASASTKTSPAPTPTPAPKEAATSTATHKPGDPLVFTPPADWKVETPSTKTRVAQYKLAKVEGDADDAELIIYHFGSGPGGTVDANIERWCTQFEQEDGTASADALTRSERKVAGLTVIDVALSGRYVAETAPGSGVRVNKPGYSMLASIIQGGDGDYFAKLIGPTKTVEHHAAAYRTFISNVK